MPFFELKVSVFVLCFAVLSNLKIMSQEFDSSIPDNNKSELGQESNHLSPSQPEGRLCIKLKLPNNNGSVNLIRRDGEEAERPVDNSRSGYRICDICGKEFSSGKAWGGHKRHHMKTMKENLNRDQALKLKRPAESIEKVGVTEGCNTIEAGDVKIEEGKPVCCLCGKSFSSMNALFGHMKFHSDRNWRGTHPPLSNNNCSNLSYRICESEPELDNVNCVEFSSSLPGWRKTDKRGKEAKESSCDPDVYRAAMILMELSQDTRVITQLEQSHKFKNLKIIESDDDDRSFLRDQFAKKMKRKAAISAKKKKKYISMLSAEDNDDELINPGGFKCNACGSSYTTFQTLGIHRSSCSGKKSEEPSQGYDDNQDENQVPSGAGNLFECDVCNKSFSTGQALGGHKRIHWKPTPVEAQQRENGYEDNLSYNRKLLGFDLNEPYVLQEDE